MRALHVTQARVRILNRMLKAKGHTLRVASLAEELDMDASGLNRALVRLVERGWVQRARLDGQGGPFGYTLTDVGRVLATQTLKEKESSMTTVPRETSTHRPLVGVGLLVVKNDHVLLGRRKGAHGEGEYSGPGGHMEFGETFEDTALQELAEECGPGLKVTMPRVLCVSNMRDYLDEGKHYVDVGMIAYWVSGEPQNMEPDKLAGWEWHPLDRLPDNRFGCVDNYVIAYQSSQPFFS